MIKSIKDMPKDERPYERALSFGVSALSDAELLSIILRTGDRNSNAVELARMVLDAPSVDKGLLGLHTLDVEELTSIKGIGPVKAIQLKAVGELCRRMTTYSRKSDVILNNPSAIAAYYMESMRYLDKEHLVMLMFDSRCRLLKDSLLSIGVVNYTVLSPREVFLEALRYKAVYLILIHNHPGGDPSPSRDDIETTKRVLEAGELLGIPLSDHIIIGDNSYFSMKENEII